MALAFAALGTTLIVSSRSIVSSRAGPATIISAAARRRTRTGGRMRTRGRRACARCDDMYRQRLPGRVV